MELTDKARRLVDPSGELYRPLKPVWDRALRVDLTVPAFDAKRGWLYGASKDGRRPWAIDLRSGAVRMEGPAIFIGVKKAKKADKKQHEKAKGDAAQPHFELCQGVLLTAQNHVDKRGDVFVSLHGLDPTTGALKWKGKTKNPWTEAWVLWCDGGMGMLGDSSTGPIYAIDVKTGKTGEISYPSSGGDVFVYGMSSPGKILFYHGKPTGEMALIARDARTNDLSWPRLTLPACLHNDKFYRPMVAGVFPCKARGTADNVDRLMRFDPATGKVLWEIDVASRKRDVLLDQQMPDQISLLDAKDGRTLYFRNRFVLARVDLSGKRLWTFALDNKEVVVVLGELVSRSENVIGGDEPYEKIFGVDPETGKEMWSYAEPQGLPARARYSEGTLVMWGEKQARVLDTKTGKLLWKLAAPRRIDAVTVHAGVVWADTPGTRQAWRLKDGAMLTHERSDDETVVQNFVAAKGLPGLLLMHDEDRRLRQIEAISGDRKYKVPPARILSAQILTPPGVEIERPRWLRTTDDIVFVSPQDTRSWRVSSKGGEAPASHGTRRREVPSPKGDEVAFLGDPKSTEETNSLQIEVGGKPRLVSERPAGEFAFTRGGRELIYAERRKPTLKSERVTLADLAVSAIDMSGGSRDILRIRGADKEAFLRSVAVSPGDKLVSLVLEKFYGNHLAITLPLRGTTTAMMKVDDGDGTVTFHIPWRQTRPPTKDVGWREGDFFGEVAWSTRGSGFSYLEGQRLYVLDSGGRRLLPYAPGSVSEMAWSPKAEVMAYNKEGNLWLFSVTTKKERQVTFFLPKREPRNEEEAKQEGGWWRIQHLAWAPDGRRMAFALRDDREALARLAVIDLGSVVGRER